MRTSGPLRPSGRRLASTGQMEPSTVVSEQIRIRVRGERGRGPHRPWPRRPPLRGFTHENDVHVGDVVQLVSPALAHRDHREPAQRRVLGRGGLGEGEGRAQRGGGEVGQLGGGLGDVDGAAHVAGGDGQQAAPVGDAQRDGVGRLGEAALELRHPAVQVPRLVGDQGLPVAGVPGEVVGERLGGAEHPRRRSRSGWPLSGCPAAPGGRWGRAAPPGSRTSPCRARSGSAVAPSASSRTGSLRTGVSSTPSSSRSAAEGSVKPCRSSRVKVLLLRPGAVISASCRTCGMDLWDQGRTA